MKRSAISFLAQQKNSLPRQCLLMLLAACCFFFLNVKLYAQLEPTASYFVLDADYGSQIGEFNPYIGTDYLVSLDVRDGGVTLLGRRQNELCSNWHHVSGSYMGAQAYRFGCASDPGDPTTKRTEQMLINKWYAGNPSDANTGVRYFSLAFKLYLPPAPPLVPKGYIAQLHQGGTGPPPFALAWVYDESKDGYFVHMGAYNDRIIDNNMYDYLYHVVSTEGPEMDDLLEIRNGQWLRVLFAIDPGTAYNGPLSLSPRAPGDQGKISAYIMDNATGLWVEAGEYEGRIGYWYRGTENNADYQPRTDIDCSYQWKIGIYRNNMDALTYYYDNIMYADRWYRITHNYLTGYHRNVLSFPFEEGSGTTIHDRSLTENSHQPIDYDNDGTINGNVSWNSAGISGSCLHFNGNGYVRIANDTVDFDFGNYQTTSVWFRTTADLPTNRGLFTVDNFGNRWKVLLYLGNSLLAYGVRHPDQSYSKANFSFDNRQYLDGEWHHAVGTFNRFAPDGKRVKLYIDGRRVLAIEGQDQPILRGEDFASVGRYSSDGYFIGDIDEVNIFNYAMTEQEVEDLFLKHGVFPKFQVAPKANAPLILKPKRKLIKEK